MLQYTTPVAIGDSSPDSAATVDSSGKRKAFLNLALGHQRASAVMDGNGLEVAIAEAGGDLERSVCSLERAVEVAHALEGDHAVKPRQVSMLDAFVLLLQEALGALHPAAADGRKLPLRSSPWPGPSPPSRRAGGLRTPCVGSGL